MGSNIPKMELMEAESEWLTRGSLQHAVVKSEHSDSLSRLLIDDTIPAYPDSEDEQMADEAEEDGGSTARGQRRKCPKCGRLLYDAKALKHHLEKRKFPCNLKVNTWCCGKNWQNAYRIRSHQESSNCSRFPKARPSRRKIFEKDRTCQSCRKVFACRKNLRDHIQGNNCGHTTMMQQARLLGRECTRCGRMFKNPRLLHVHLSRRKPCLDRSLLAFCPVCGRGLASDSYLRKHMESRSCRPPPAKTKKEAKPILCPRCGRTFRRQSKMERHVRLRLPHCLDPGYLDCCGNTFSSLLAVKRHRRVFHQADSTPQPPTLTSSDTAQASVPSLPPLMTPIGIAAASGSDPSMILTTLTSPSPFSVPSETLDATSSDTAYPLLSLPSLSQLLGRE